ncbi:hypothetical protein GGE45_003907 [Rhizobium aethiopicum]|uniref:hypothetical protein n=1 Tax=Rhizobium aethiopicum TaxID=1138170 RepID=UPI001612A956|nr:hypothetical protein [Rhizobium aethiopicum]MBB4581559.1 hypothetical protein [Rhizobium aethiopicum]
MIGASEPSSSPVNIWREPRGVSRGKIPDSLVRRAIRLTKLTDVAKAPSEGRLRLEPAIVLGMMTASSARASASSTSIWRRSAVSQAFFSSAQVLDVLFDGHRLISLGS